jgi:hypothetical protein
MEYRFHTVGGGDGGFTPGMNLTWIPINFLEFFGNFFLILKI